MITKRESIDLLRRSVHEWNRRRQADQPVLLELCDADLSDSDLRGANLRGVDFSNANLNRAKLDRADLTKACLHSARLIGASLSGVQANQTDFRGACFRDADLTGSDLRESRFGKARWQNTKLDRVDLRGSEIERSELEYEDVSTAQLDDVVDLDHHHQENDALNDSRNILLRFLERDVDELTDLGPAIVTRRAVTGRALLLLALSGGIAAAVWKFFAEGAGGFASFLLVLSIAAMALLPQLGRYVPPHRLPIAALGGAILCGLVVGGFATLTWAVSPIVIVQAFGTVALSLVLVLLLGNLGPRLGNWTATVTVIIGSFGLATLAFQALGIPWIIPFIAERGVYPPLPIGHNPSEPAADALISRLITLLAFPLILMSIRQAVLDWRLLERRIEQGLPRHLVWSAAVVLVGIVPLTAIQPFLGRGRARKKASST